MGAYDCQKCSSFQESRFCSLKEKSLSLLNENKQRFHFKKNQRIFHNADLPRGVYCVASGVVKLCHIDEQGSEVILRIQKEGDVLGYRAFFAQEQYQASAIAHEDCELCFIPTETFRALLSEPLLAIQFLKQLSLDLRHSEDRLSSVVSKPVQQRIAEALIYLKDELPNSKWTRRDIADWVGTTPETVIRTLSKFEESKLIAQEGRAIHIQNLEGLQALS